MSQKLPWRVRPAGKRDQKVLAAFRCADPAVPWQVEVEVFIQRDALKWALEPFAAAADPRLRPAFERARWGGSARTAAHERARRQLPGYEAGGCRRRPHLAGPQVRGGCGGWPARERRGHVRSDDGCLGASAVSGCPRVCRSPPRQRSKCRSMQALRPGTGDDASRPVLPPSRHRPSPAKGGGAEVKVFVFQDALRGALRRYGGGK